MEPSDFLPKSFNDILVSGAVTMPTRAILQARLTHVTRSGPVFFSEAQFDTLKAACARLIPQDAEAEAVDLPGLLDAQLKESGGKGWRYDTLPPDETMYQLGLEGIDQTANALYVAPFHRIPAREQDEILTAVQLGKAPGSVWQRLPSARFFEELLAAIAALYYSHPIAKWLVQDLSFADARGWHNIGLQEQHDDCER